MNDMNDTDDQKVADSDDDSLLPFHAAFMLPVMGFGIVLVRRRRNGVRIAGLLLLAVALAIVGLDQVPASAQLRSLKDKKPIRKLGDPKEDEKKDDKKGGLRSLTGGEIGKAGAAITDGAKTPAEKRKRALAYLLNMPKPPADAKPIEVPGLAPLPPRKAANAALVELGMMLFFDNRISGDADITCAQCHNPAEGWGTRDPLSTGYPGTRYFRNASTVLNVAYADYLYWDGRLGGDDLARVLAAQQPGTVLCVDEAYVEYAAHAEGYRSAADLLAGHDKPLLILRTFSKAWGLAGLRIGFGVTNSAELRRGLDLVRTPFNVNHVAQGGAIAALAHADEMRATVAATVAERERMARGLAALNLRCLPSAGNFLFVDTGRDAGALADGLLDRGVIVKPWKQPGYESWMRISVGTGADTDQLLTALAMLL